MLEIETDFDLSVMRKNQSPNEVASRVLAKLDKILDAEKPDLILVQGDTTTTLAGALAGFNRRIPVGHVEAGLRSGNLHSPFPEEMNRRVVSQIATFHFTATEQNRSNLLREGIASENWKPRRRFVETYTSERTAESADRAIDRKHRRHEADLADNSSSRKLRRDDGR
jgi:UDP-N-acetylglucosamine 2-epimerase